MSREKTKDFSETSRRLQALKDALGLTTEELAKTTGLKQTALNQYLYRHRGPDPLPCLLIASIAPDEIDRRYWIGQSGLEEGQLKALRRVLSGEHPIVSGQSISDNEPKVTGEHEAALVKDLLALARSGDQDIVVWLEGTLDLAAKILARRQDAPRRKSRARARRESVRDQ